MALTPAAGSGCGASSTPPPPTRSDRPANSQVEWDSFDPQAYVRHNYSALRDDDREILGRTRDFFADAELSDVRCVDVGSGANLYPALSLLPFAHSMDLCEWSTPNVSWLRTQIDHYDELWDPYWRVCAEHPTYAALADPRIRLAQVGRVRQTSVFDLPKHAWDAGTMFFVACSISADPAESQHAIGRFLGALRPGAPFAVAFMLGSRGYHVGQRWFPAVALQRADVVASIAAGAYDLDLHEVRPTPPLRDGYLSMLLATGRTRA
ncbi:SCO2525 family SAM-dependent methyltransferase [Micromonospora sp. DR5-3]|uniref:SCO2525 family SAM-dependent methyltransferase n=1 Tax=unclassified Micromonospora TaxID=2617518 RepID=UPI0011D43E14|nr:MULTISPECIES: SCO2525 family SAM-dependent methyltransferase [unclassified Micromonospora]MCW3816401.1 SCO2525 family SAM-dependent methyltransferase [Micromonospora sp. DR5-3]TYC22728.1 methyltransferase [Micromonospora sp. MP36]